MIEKFVSVVENGGGTVAHERFELLVFDLDGTLADTKHDIATAVNLTLAEVGLPVRTPEQIYGFVGSGVRRLLQQCVGEDEGPRLSAVLRIFRRHYLAHLLDQTRLYEGIPRVLEAFRQRRKTVATNKPQVYTDPLLKGLGVHHLFDLVFGAESGLPIKPQPEMILETLRRLGISKQQALMIGDGIHDIQAARAAGIRVCAVGYGLGDPDELRAAAPDFFASVPEDLLQVAQ